MNLRADRMTLGDQRQAILDLMVNEDGSVRDVLFSELREKLGIDLRDQAFEGLRRDGVIKAYFPEAKPGDSGRQFWGFAHCVAMPAIVIEAPLGVETGNTDSTEGKSAGRRHRPNTVGTKSEGSQ